MSVSLYVPHGAPTFSIQPEAAGPALVELGKQHRSEIKGVVVISPHWQTSIPTVGTANAFETIHDYFGFPDELREINYPAKGSDTLATQVVHALEAVGAPVCADNSRGLDHGAWVPLRYMFPDADLPVTPLSLLREGGPKAAYRLGQALEPLVQQGVLVMGTGSLTHNLSDYRVCVESGQGTPEYVRRFSEWLAEKAESRDLEQLFDYRNQAPDAKQAHPTEEHLLPFFVALGAAGKGATAKRIHQSVQNIVLSMDAYRFTPATPL